MKGGATMSKAQYGLVLVLAMLSGLLGGAATGLIAGTVSSQVFPPKFLRAKRFAVVNKRGKILASLDESGLTFFEHEGAGIPVTLNAGGHLKLQSAGRLIEIDANNLFLKMYESDGRAIWQIPEQAQQLPTDIR
jgi:hypothetical protein